MHKTRFLFKNMHFILFIRIFKKILSVGQLEGVLREGDTEGIQRFNKQGVGPFAVGEDEI